MTKLLLVRHGETDWNREQRWQGHADPPLNELGREQARELAASIEPTDVIYTSDLRRAAETAEIVGAHLKIDVVADERLRERNFGAWEGLTRGDIEERFPDDLRRWRADEGHGAPDAETYDEFGARIQSFVDDVIARHPDERVLVVAHGGTIRVIHAIAAGLAYGRYHRDIPFVENCGLSRCVVRDGKLARLD